MDYERRESHSAAHLRHHSSRAFVAARARLCWVGRTFPDGFSAFHRWAFRYRTVTPLPTSAATSWCRVCSHRCGSGERTKREVGRRSRPSRRHPKAFYKRIHAFNTRFSIIHHRFTFCQERSEADSKSVRADDSSLLECGSNESWSGADPSRSRLKVREKKNMKFSFAYRGSRSLCVDGD